MQFKDTLRFSALFMCASALLVSCITVDKSLADDFIPNDQKVFLKTVELPLPLTVMPADSIQGTSGGDIVIGSLRTKEFGNAEFDCAANISLNNKLNFGENAVVKSIYISMPKSSTQYLNESQEGIAQNITVYRTSRELDSTTLYNNSIKESDYDHSPISINQGIYLGGDSLRIYLQNSLGEEIVKLSKSELDSNSLFIKKMKGLYLKCSPAQQSVNGGRLNIFSLSSAYIVMKINFKPTWESNLAKKDTTIYLKFGNSFCLNTSNYQSHNSHLINNKDLSELPVEGIAGLKPYISASALKDLIDKWIKSENLNPSKIIVSNAKVELPFEAPLNYNFDNYPSYLYPTIKTTDSSKFFYPLNDINSTNNNMGAMNRSLNTYYGDMSATMQAFINGSQTGKRSESNIWFCPVVSSYNQYTSITSYYTSTSTYNVGKVNGPAAKRYPKITLVYTVVQ